MTDAGKDRALRGRALEGQTQQDGLMHVKGSKAHHERGREEGQEQREPGEDRARPLAKQWNVRSDRDIPKNSGFQIFENKALDKKLKHDIEIVVDRIVVKPDIGNRLPDSIETALNLADGLLVVEFADEKEKGRPCRRVSWDRRYMDGQR